jgi:hypothetical protein
LHAADVLLHSATQAPDNPQFIAHEKPSVSQREMHWATVWTCASHILPANLPAWLDVAANRTKPITASDFMALLRECVSAAGRAPLRRTFS